MIDRRLENQVLLTADKIITVGNSLKDLFVAKMPEIRNKIEVITNGYDEDDFKGLNASNPDKFTISYIGTLSDSYPVNGFLDAVHAYNNKGNECNLKFVGTVSPRQKELIISKIGKSMVEFIPYVDHATAINYMLDASVLLLIIPDHESNKSIITGKLFEYIASGKPVLCIGPVDGDAAGIINLTESGRVYGYNDINGIYSFIDNKQVNSPTVKEKVIKDFSRYNLTKKVISLM
jgi:glycosyltransferase involved in cell wall biosynthesis